mmetsp:Transcript_37627/g.70182  ORF Transcript_37627/g.70182 Transcript_37627/m.70182 type:complete len:81 (+) Transcript_37627:424-666(+)
MIESCMCLMTFSPVTGRCRVRRIRTVKKRRTLFCWEILKTSTMWRLLFGLNGNHLPFERREFEHDALQVQIVQKLADLHS